MVSANCEPPTSLPSTLWSNPPALGKFWEKTLPHCSGGREKNMTLESSHTNFRLSMRVCNSAVTTASAMHWRLCACSLYCLSGWPTRGCTCRKLLLIFEHHQEEGKKTNQWRWSATPVIFRRSSAAHVCHRLCIGVASLSVTLRLSSRSHGDWSAEGARLGCCVTSCSSSSEWLIGTLVQLSFSFSLYS